MRHVSPGLIPVLTTPLYTPVRDLWVITTYFNPCRYETRRRNYDLFAHAMRASGINLLTIECAFGDQEFELPESIDVVRIRAKSLLWQKERLLNLAASWLPPDCRYVAWADCDVLFTNPNWAVDTAELLQTHTIVQLFESCVRLVKGNHLIANPNRVPSFASIVSKDRSLVDSGSFERHGHTGYAWAMRRELFKSVGLYEYAVCGTGDHFIAHAVYNDHGFCIQHAFLNERRQMQHLSEWSNRFYEEAGERLAAVPGEILHLWHGDLVNRKYAIRMHEITHLGFDPYVDIAAYPGRPLDWHSDINKPDLVSYFAEYFKSRREDG